MDLSVPGHVFDFPAGDPLPALVLWHLGVHVGELLGDVGLEVRIGRLDEHYALRCRPGARGVGRLSFLLEQRVRPLVLGCGLRQHRLRLEALRLVVCLLRRRFAASDGQHRNQHSYDEEQHQQRSSSGHGDTSFRHLYFLSATRALRSSVTTETQALASRFSRVSDGDEFLIKRA